MKRMLYLLLVLLMTVCLAACAAGSPTESPGKTDSSETDALPAVIEEKPEKEPLGDEQPEAPVPPEDGAGADAQDPQNSVLVVVFSATGNTRGVAEKIAALTGADLAEIIPAQPYTAEDLNYSDRTTRTSLEQNDPSARPELAGDISLAGYSTVYLGYPIWWGQAPRILSTFVESHSFDGITVIPFCTSGSSDIGQSGETLAAQAGSGTWLQGRRFPGSVTEDVLRQWIEETAVVQPETSLHLYINGTEVAVAWESNESVSALTELAASGPLAIQMSAYGGFEQVGPIGTALPRDDVQLTAQPGDIVLYSGNQLVVFYGSNSWAYTRLGKITDRTAQELSDLLGADGTTVTLVME